MALAKLGSKFGLQNPIEEENGGGIHVAAGAGGNRKEVRERVSITLEVQTQDHRAQREDSAWPGKRKKAPRGRCHLNWV